MLIWNNYIIKLTFTDDFLAVKRVIFRGKAELYLILLFLWISFIHVILINLRFLY